MKTSVTAKSSPRDPARRRRTITTGDLMHFSMFKGLSSQQLYDLLALLDLKTMPADKACITFGEQSNAILFLLSGAAKLWTEGKDGSKTLLRIAGRGEVLGEVEALEQSSYRYNATTCVDSEFLLMEMADVEQYRSATSRFNDNLLHHLARRVSVIADRDYALQSQTALRSLALELLHLAAVTGNVSVPPGRMVIPLVLTQCELGQLIGMTRQGTNALLLMLQRQHIIEYNAKRRFIINDLVRLRGCGEGHCLRRDAFGSYL